MRRRRRSPTSLRRTSGAHEVRPLPAGSEVGGGAATSRAVRSRSSGFSRAAFNCLRVRARFHALARPPREQGVGAEQGSSLAEFRDEQLSLVRLVASASAAARLRQSIQAVHPPPPPNRAAAEEHVHLAPPRRSRLRPRPGTRQRQARWVRVSYWGLHSASLLPSAAWRSVSLAASRASSSPSQGRRAGLLRAQDGRRR